MTREESVIREAMGRSGISSRAALSDLINISDRTMKRKFHYPDGITLRELRLIIEVVGMQDKEILEVVKGCQANLTTEQCT